MEKLPSIEVKWVTAPNDGVAPALLLTVHRGKAHTTPVQYLINVPEGFARLVLEHRCRPGPGLRAAFLTGLSQAALGGLAGLLLRLRQDGHAALRLMGPAGLRDAVDGLSAFVRWTHPALTLSCLTAADQGCVYEDECVEVRPLWASCLLWQVPDWLQQAAEAGRAEAAAGAATKGASAAAGAAAGGRSGGARVADAAEPPPAGGAPSELAKQEEGGKEATPRRQQPDGGDGGRGPGGGGVGGTGHRAKRARRSDRGADDAPGSAGGGGGGGGATAAPSAASAPDPLAALKSALARTSAAAAAAWNSRQAPGGGRNSCRGRGRRGGALSPTLQAAAAAVAANAANVAGRKAPVAPDPGLSASDSEPGAWESGGSSSSGTTDADAEAGHRGGATVQRGAGLKENRRGSAETVHGTSPELRRSGAAGGVGARARSSNSSSSTSSGSSDDEDGEGGSGCDKGGATESTRDSGGSSSSSSSISSSSSSSSNSGTSNSTNQSSDEGAAQKRRREKQSAAPAVAPVGPPARPPADLFSELDRLFMQAAGAAVPGPGSGSGARGTGRGAGRGGGRSGPRGGRGAAGPPRASALGWGAGVDATLRSAVLARLVSAPVPQQQPNKRKDAEQAQDRGAPHPVQPTRATVPAPRAASLGHARPSVRGAGAAASLPARTAGATATATGAAGAAGARPVQQQPLGFLLYLKPIRQVLLLAAPHDAADAEALAAHPAVQLLAAAAPTGVLLAAAHLAPPALSRRASYRRWVRAVRSRHVWCGQERGAASGGGGSGATIWPGGLSSGGGNGADGNNVGDVHGSVARNGSIAVRPVDSERATREGTQPAKAKVPGQALERPAAGPSGLTPAETGSPLSPPAQPATAPPSAPSAAHSPSAPSPPASVPAAPAPAPAPLASLGHLASCRVTARLNAVAPSLFPLPFVLRKRRPGAQAGPGSGAAADGGRQPADTSAIAGPAGDGAEVRQSGGGGDASGGVDAVPGAAGAAPGGDAGDSGRANEERTDLAAGEGGGPEASTRAQSPAGRHVGAGDVSGQGSGAAVMPKVAGAAAAASPTAPALPRHLHASLLSTLTATTTSTATGIGIGALAPALPSVGPAAAGANGSRKRRSASASRKKAAADGGAAEQWRPAATALRWEQGLCGWGAATGDVGRGGAKGAGAGSATFGGTAAPAAANGAGSDPIVSLQTELLWERRGSGLAQMLQALHAACPDLASTAEAHRMLRPPPQPPPLPSLQPPYHERQQGHSPTAAAGEATAAPAHGALAQPLQATQGRLYKQQQPGLGAATAPWQPNRHQQPSLSDAAAAAATAWPDAYPGAWQVQTCWEPQLQRGAADVDAAAEAELAAAAASYGAVERRGRLMRPTYAAGAGRSAGTGAGPGPWSGPGLENGVHQRTAGHASAPYPQTAPYGAYSEYGMNGWNEDHRYGSRLAEQLPPPQPWPPQPVPAAHQMDLYPGHLSDLRQQGAAAVDTAEGRHAPAVQSSAAAKGTSHQGAPALRGKGATAAGDASRMEGIGAAAGDPGEARSVGAVSNRTVAARLRQVLEGRPHHVGPATSSGICAGAGAEDGAIENRQVAARLRQSLLHRSEKATTAAAAAGGEPAKSCGGSAVGDLAIEGPVALDAKSAAATNRDVAARLQHALRPAAAPVDAKQGMLDGDTRPDGGRAGEAASSLSAAAVTAPADQLPWQMEGFGLLERQRSDTHSPGATAGCPQREAAVFAVAAGAGAAALNRDVARQVRSKLTSATAAEAPAAAPATTATTIRAAMATLSASALPTTVNAATAEAQDAHGGDDGIDGNGAPAQAAMQEAAVEGGAAGRDNWAVAARLRATLRVGGAGAGVGVQELSSAATGSGEPPRPVTRASPVTGAEAAEAAAAKEARPPVPFLKPVEPASGGGIADMSAPAAARLATYVAELSAYSSETAAMASATGNQNNAPREPAATDAASSGPSQLVAYANDAATPAGGGSQAPSPALPPRLPRHVSLLFLGTGSAEPSKYRGPSGVLLRGLGPTRGSLLIDAGEGTFGALVRWLGHRGAVAEVSALSLVWLSHKHPDHVLGLPALLEARPPACPPLLVVGPQEVAFWLSRVAPLHPSWRFTFLHCADFVGGAHSFGPGGTLSYQPAHSQQPQQQQAQQVSPIGGYPADPVPPAQASAQWPGPPGPAGCYCCPPYRAPAPAASSLAGYPWGGAGASGADPLTPPLAAAPLTKSPAAAARLRWHQQRRALGAQPPALHTQPAHPQPPTVQAAAVAAPAQQRRQPSESVGPAQVAGRGAGQQWSREAGLAAAVASCASLGMVRWQSVGVHHCRDAWGLVLVAAEGWKLVYSGDTRPCPALISAGSGATLLLHEATFEPCLEQQARRKRHCTSAEAAQVAEAMGAYRTVLTHFSQRYPHMPAGLDPWVTPPHRRPMPAFDGLLLPLAALPALPLLLPPLAEALGYAATEADEAATVVEEQV